MNKRGHVINAVLLSAGIGYILEPSGTEATFYTVAEVGMPVVLGALFPDVDTAFGKHRKTLHNLLVLGAFLAFPLYFGNLHFVWIGVATHYVLDVVGSKRGIAPFYPLWSEEFGFPTGVTTSSKWTDVVTVAVTVVELAAIAVVVYRVPQLTIDYGRQMIGI